MVKKAKSRAKKNPQCDCNITHYFDRVKESFNRINRTKQNQGTTNLAFLVIHEIHYIFCDCDRVIAGFIFNDEQWPDISGNSNNLIPQPVNSCQLASRLAKKDLFHALLSGLEATPIHDRQGIPRHLLKITQEGAYRVRKPPCKTAKGKRTPFAFSSGMFAPDGEIFLYIINAPAKSRLYILWQKRSDTPHTCVQKKYEAVCSQQTGKPELRSSLDILFKKYEEKFVRSVKERPACKVTTLDRPRGYPTPLIHRPRRPQLNEAIEHSHRTLAENLGVNEEDISRDIFFFRTISPQTNDLILHFPPVSCRFLFKTIKKQLNNSLFSTTLHAVKEKISRDNLEQLLPNKDDISDLCKDIDVPLTEDLLEQVKVFRQCFWKNDCAEHIENSDIQAIYFAALFKNLSEGLPQRRGPLVRAGRQGVPEIIEPGHLTKLLKEDDPFSFLMKVTRRGTSCKTAFLFPVLYNDRLFGLTVFFPTGKGDSTMSRAELLNNLINFHQANGQFLVQAGFQDILADMRDTLSVSPKGGIENTVAMISEQLSEGFGVPATYILNAATLKPGGLDEIPGMLHAKDNNEFKQELSRWIWPANTRFEYLIAGKLPILESCTDVSGIHMRLYPRVRVVKVEEYRFIMIFLLHSPWRYTPILQKGFIADIASNFGAGLRIRKARHDMLRKGARAAVAAIMGRNMSHNLGSHVLSYWIKKKRHEEYSRDLFSYLRHRMDFIAEIATSQPCWSTSLLFCRDILCPFFAQASLLDFLGRSEDVHFSSCDELGCPADSHHARLSFEVYRRDDSEQKQIFGWKNINEVPAWFNCNNERYELANFKTFAGLASPVLAPVDIPVSIPHGLTGIHAFYSILENFIRNSVKHCGDNRQEFVVKIIIDDSDPDLVRIKLEDSRQRCSPEIHKRLQRGFSQKLSDNRGELIPGNWGLKEMKISACYLRMGRTDLLDEERAFQPGWLHTAWNKPYISPSCDRCSNKNGNNKEGCRVGFTLYLLKPKEAMFLAPDLHDLKAANSTDVSVIDPAGFREQYAKTTVPHRILFYPEEDSESLRIIKDNLSSLPVRNLGLELARLKNMPPNPVLIFSVWLRHLCKRHFGKPGDFPHSITVMYRRTGEPGNEVFVNSRKEYDYNFTFRSHNELAFQQEEMIILFDEHGRFQDQPGADKDKIIYYQATSGAMPVKQIVNDLEKLPSESARKLRMLEIIESAITRVVIADERIWEAYGAEQFNREFLDMNITLIPIKDRKPEPDKLKEILDNEKADFCIIHLGLLDKLEETDRERVFNMILSSGAGFIVTSGRGTPYNLPSGARFLEISTLESLLAEKNKFGLTQVLYSLRRSQYV